MYCKGQMCMSHKISIRPHSIAKILEIGPYPPPIAGWAIRIEFVCKRILKEGHLCDVLNLGKNRKVPSHQYVTVHNGFDYLAKLMWYAAKRYTFHMHTNGDGLVGLILALFAVTIGFLFGRRSVLSFHAGTHQMHFPREHSGWMYPILFSIFKLSKVIICNNKAVKKKIQEYHIPAKKIIPIPAFGSQYIEFCEAALPNQVEKFISTHDPVISTYVFFREGFYIRTLLEGLMLIRERWPKAGLVNAGALVDNEETNLKNSMDLLRHTGLTEHLCLADGLTHDQFLTLLRHTKLYLRTPTSDGECASVMEALTLGVPVVAAENGNRPASVVTYVADDPASMRDKVSEVLLNYQAYCDKIIKPPVHDTVGEETAVLIDANLR
jgi:glycosyltransferase involved in cell wall biosynthesis